MRNNFSKFALTATLGLAIIFTLNSCHGDGGGDDNENLVSSSSRVTQSSSGKSSSGGTALSSSGGSSSSGKSSSSSGNASSSSGRNACTNELLGCNLLENATYRAGNLPAGETAFIEVQMGSTIISGGSNILTITSNKELSKLYISFEGDNGYYEINISNRDLVSSKNGNYIYDVFLQLTQNLLDGKSQMRFSGLAINSQVSLPIAKNVESIKVGSGSLQISLSWNTIVDLDLHITNPSGGTIYFDSKKIDNGELDLDANVGCPTGSEDKRNENVFFTAPLADGDYTVAVNMYRNCIATATKYMVSAYSTGNNFVFSDLQLGEFIENTSSGTKKIIGVIRVSNGSVTGGSSSSGAGRSSSGGDAIYEKGSFTDLRDGKEYKTVEIGTQIWLAQNLNYDAPGSKCYNNDTKNCDKYGRLYDWNTAITACPDGWHLPNNAEWDRLYRYADGTNGTDSPYNSLTAGRYLKAASGWNNNGNGVDKYGFAALPGGGGSSDGSFGNVGNGGDWWSSSEDAHRAYNRYMDYYYDGVSWYKDLKSDLFSVRCVED